MLRYWHQQMQLVVYLAQMATLVVQSCHRYPQVWKGALQKLLAWVQDLIKLRQGAYSVTKATWLRSSKPPISLGRNKTHQIIGEN